MTETKRGSFTSSLGFVLAAAGSAVGLGNLWRFPYLAARDGGGLFLVVYLILTLTFGFALMTTEVAIGRYTGKSPINAFKILDSRFTWVGWIAALIPALIFPYYCVIGGWVCKYALTYITGNGANAVDASGGFFYSVVGAGDAFWSPIVCFLVFMLVSGVIVYFGVEKGIEKCSTILMPILLLLIIGIAIYSLTLTDPVSGRTAIDGLKIYLIPEFENLTLSKFLSVVFDAICQLFFSLSLAMGIMITYGSYMKKDASLPAAINQIEIFDTLIAFVAGLIMVPTVFCYMGREGLSASGPSLLFISLPQVFGAMGSIGNVIGAFFFLLVIFAALTSSVSIMEAIVSMVIDRFGVARKIACLIVGAVTIVIGVVTCLGYNVLYFESSFAPIAGGQILDILDWLTNSLLMPIVAIFTCIVIGWFFGTDRIIGEVKLGDRKFAREKLYVVMTKFVSPVLLFIIFLNSFGIIKF